MQIRNINQTLQCKHSNNSQNNHSANQLRSAFSNPYPNLTVSRISMSRALTEKQIQRLFAIAHSKRWTRQEVNTWIENTFWKKDISQLTRFEYDRTCTFILENPAYQIEKLRA